MADHELGRSPLPPLDDGGGRDELYWIEGAIRLLDGFRPTGTESVPMSVRANLTRLALTGAIAGLLSAAPAVAEPASIVPEGTKVNGFSQLQRTPLPGERVAPSQFPGYAPGGPELGFGGAGIEQEESDPDVGVTLHAVPGNGPVYAQRDTRMSRLMGDCVMIYENPVRSGYLGYNPRTGGYDRWHGSLSYNHSYLRHLYDGNLAGTPSVSAPTDFWSGQR